MSPKPPVSTDILGIGSAATPTTESRLYKAFDQLRTLTQRLDHVRDRLLGSSPPSAAGEPTGILMDGIEATLGALAETVEAIETAI